MQSCGRAGQACFAVDECSQLTDTGPKSAEEPGGLWTLHRYKVDASVWQHADPSSHKAMALPFGDSCRDASAIGEVFARINSHCCPRAHPQSRSGLCNGAIEYC